MSQPLYPHQQGAIENACSRRFLLIIRALGSGKTAIALHIADRLLAGARDPGLLVCPAHLLRQTQAELSRWSLGLSLTVLDTNQIDSLRSGCLYGVSYDRLRLASSVLCTQKWGVVIVDEFQHAKNSATRNHQLLSHIRKHASRFVGMTGAPIQNGPREFFNIVAIVSGKCLQNELETCLAFKRHVEESWVKRFFRRLFRVRVNQGPIVGVRFPEKLKKLIEPYIDYVSEDDYIAQCNLPAIRERFTEVELERSEVQEYRKMLRKHRKKIDRLIMTDDLDDDMLASSYRRLADLRQGLLGDVQAPSSKVRRLCESVRAVSQEPGNRILVFSNFVEHGVAVISAYLSQLGIEHSIYVGGISKDAKESKVALFKSGDKPVLVLSPVGFEGLDLVGATHVYVADPHYNPAVTAQLVARATRAGSVVREVVVEHFLSTATTLEKGTIDQAIVRIARRKAEVNSLIKAALITGPGLNRTKFGGIPSVVEDSIRRKSDL